MPASRSRRPSGRSSCRAPTRPSTSCSCARATSPSTCRTASSTSASRGRTSSSRPRRTSSRSPSSDSHAAPSQAAVPNDAPQAAIDDLGGLRIATAYPVSTRKLLAERGIEVELVTVSGSVEATPRLGLADAIVDLVSTGSTASANGLRLIGTLLSSRGRPDRWPVGRGRAGRPRRAARADARRASSRPAVGGT